ncbi:putative uracil DNA glycosylase [Diachasmimorpha longicaudata entomopoxvirus]|uniref:Putative uracil DNA glycosylase n=1 Tax=Diachasmimorpha longicaudata entomopoxvirus TaxID=109981 RepID=A0A7R5WRV6_9POXV|nr:putative uracil DNA glycosylase [Diachasmimorpha longicaudata entomopoxvirus]AKS26338.1 putative uracil DNA glycosylase [Diachasmimorpha longicaudata entomopoxvirus]
MNESALIEEFGIDPSWYPFLTLYKDKIYNILDQLEKKDILPERKDIFKCLALTSLDKLKVVILGNEPYPQFGLSNGLAYGVKGLMCPTPLRNILKEVYKDLENIEMPPLSLIKTDLTHWAEDGVLLLNSILTVFPNELGSCKDLGWEEITDGLIRFISSHKKNVVFLLWGQNAQKKGYQVDPFSHQIYAASHPGAYSAHGFFGCKHFSATNMFLKKKGLTPVRFI